MYVWAIFFEEEPGRWILLKLFSSQEKAEYAFVTKRDKFVKDGEQFLALIITPPKTVSSISSWMLFSKDETVIDGGIINGIDANYL